VLLAAVVGSATIFVILTLAVDVLGPLLDPRARQQIS